MVVKREKLVDTADGWVIESMMMEPFGVLYIWKEPVLTAGQLDRLSNIADNAGNVFFAIGVVAPLFTFVDTPNWFVILVGVTATASFWWLSVMLAKKGDLP